MTGELVPNDDPRAKLLMADADRERAVAQLHTAVGEGRLTLSEFEDRMSGVLASRTFGEITPFLEDLPTVAPTSAEPVEISVRGSRAVREGAWVVPSRMRVVGAGSTVVLDFTAARFVGETIHIDVDLRGSSLRLIVSQSVSVDAAAAALSGSAVRMRKLPEPSGAPSIHVVITGQLHGSTIRVGPRRRRWFRRQTRTS